MELIELRNLILIFDRPPCSDAMGIVGWWWSTPYTEAIETLDSVHYLVNFTTFYFLFRCPIPGVFLSYQTEPVQDRNWFCLP